MTQKTGLSALIDELRRRRVFRVAAFYGGIAFVIVQIIDGTFELMGVPQWVGRVMVTLLALGFPVSMILAWVFDITPEGIVRTAKADTGGDYPVVDRKAQPLIGNSALAIIAIVAVAFGVFSRSSGDSNESSGARGYTSSVAVLPFSNLNNDPEQEFFSIGITDNILTNLHKFGNLKVIGRTSVMQYRGTTKRLSVIGAELGVTTIVEGSVQRSGDRIVINAQLIDAKTEDHLWAEKYDRRIDDIFDIQSEVADAIAKALQVTLTPAASALRINEYRPTENLAAWEAYSRGIILEDEATRQEQTLQAIDAFEEATRHDPGFAEAWAHLAEAHVFYRWLGVDMTEERLSKAEWALTRAQTLAPENPTVLNATGRYYYHGFNDYARALQQFYKALAIQPANALILPNIGYIERRLGNFDEAMKIFLRARELDPRSVSIHLALAQTSLELGRLDESKKYSEQLRLLSPTSALYYDDLMYVTYLITGSFEEAALVIEKGADFIPEVEYLELKSEHAFWVGDYDAAASYLRREQELHPPGHERLSTSYYDWGFVHYFAGRPDMAQPHFEKFLNYISVKVENEQSAVQFSYLPTMAITEAMLGMADSAIFHAAQAVANYPITLDAYAGYSRLVDQAFVHHILGENGRAIAILDAIAADHPPVKYGLSRRWWNGLKELPEFATFADKHNLPEISRRKLPN